MLGILGSQPSADTPVTDRSPRASVYPLSASRLMPYAAALALVGLALWHAGVQPLWMDETYGLLFAQRPFSALLQALGGQ